MLLQQEFMSKNVWLISNIYAEDYATLSVNLPLPSIDLKAEATGTEKAWVK